MGQIGEERSDGLQLSEAYGAALQFIDARLSGTSTLPEIEDAAARRQQSLTSLPAPVAGADLDQLTEALDFVRRAYGKMGGADVPTELVVRGDELELPASEFTTLHNQPHANGNGNGNGHYAEHHNGNGHATLAGALADLTTDEPAGDSDDGPIELHVATESLPRRRRSPLSRLWDDVPDADPGNLLPEQKAWPLAQGILLLAVEAWLGLFAGWVATRFISWPRPGLGYELSNPGGLGVILLGFAGALAAGWLIWRYRLSSRKLALLAHAGAVLVALDLLAWHLAAVDSVPVIEGPAAFAWILLGLGWLIVIPAAHISDLRQS